MSKLSTLGSVTLLCIASLTIMVGSIVAPGMISISAQLDVADNAILLITLPALGAVIFAPIAGKLIDKYGAYPSVIIGMFLYGLFGAGAIFLEGAFWVFTNRLLLGGLTALVMASSTVLISQWYQGQERLIMIAKQGMAIELGGVIFLFFGGILAAQYWALPFLLYLTAWLFLIMLLLYVPRNSVASLDKSETENDEQIVPDGLSLKSIYLFSVLSMGTFFTIFVLLPFAMHTQGYDEQQVGILLSSISLVAVIAASFMPRLSKVFGEPKLLATAFIVYGIAFICFIQTGLILLIVGAIFSGIGFGFSIPLLNHMTVKRSSYKVRGKNLSYFTMAVFSGQFLTSFLEGLSTEPANVFGFFIGFCCLLALGLFVTSIRTPLKSS
ncbi:MFS transporter [uncultured Paraglaciecola sp.]|uniref:MFS transporter n=1 Tax=uncultured Paraglaciecola sp. TaxID=1765024 RepID=UPI002595ECC9|nr:MFS transporter [uncultured Paraglaciecola sp.]